MSMTNEQVKTLMAPVVRPLVRNEWIKLGPGYQTFYGKGLTLRLVRRSRKGPWRWRVKEFAVVDDEVIVGGRVLDFGQVKEDDARVAMPDGDLTGLEAVKELAHRAYLRVLEKKAEVVV